MNIKIKNLDINYIEEGPDTKTSVILLHGWGANIASFNPVINYLSKKIKVYAIDFPGFGDSQKPDPSYNVEGYSKLVYEFIKEKKLKEENVVLIGHSFGGRVIIKLVGALGFNPNRIILIDSAGVKPKKNLKRKVKEKIYKVTKKLIRIALGQKKSEKVILKLRSKMGSQDYKNADETMKEVFKNVINEDLTKYLENIFAPTLLVWGELDQETPLSDAKLMEQKLKDGGLVIIKGAGHFSYLNNINQFLAVTDSFLEGCE